MESQNSVFISPMLICPTDKQAKTAVLPVRQATSLTNTFHTRSPNSARNINVVGATSKTIVMFEGADARDPDTAPDTATRASGSRRRTSPPRQVMTQMKLEVQINRHDGSANYPYADGHVELIGEETIGGYANSGFNFAKPQ